MFQKIFTGFVSTLLLSAVAVAGPNAGGKSVDYVESYVKKTETQSKSGKSKEEIRKEAVESLRKAGYAKEELELVGAGKSRELPVERQAAMLRTLKADETFQVRVGVLQTVRRADVGRTLEKDILALQEGSKASELERSLGKSDLASLDNVAKSFREHGDSLVEVLAKADSVSFPRLIAIAKNGAKHIKQLERDIKRSAKKGNKAKTEELEAGLEQFKTNMVALMDVALQSKGIKGLEKTGILGEGLAKACGDPAKGGLSLEAKNNFTKFIERAVLEAKDVEGVIKAGGKAASEKFDESALAGEKRFCALAKAPCEFMSAPVKAMCAKRFP